MSSNVTFDDRDEAGDVRNMTYEAGRFDAVIDKATLDCFYVSVFHEGRQRID